MVKNSTFAIPKIKQSIYKFFEVQESRNLDYKVINLIFVTGSSRALVHSIPLQELEKWFWSAMNY